MVKGAGVSPPADEEAEAQRGVVLRDWLGWAALCESHRPCQNAVKGSREGPVDSAQRVSRVALGLTDRVSQQQK